MGYYEEQFIKQLTDALEALQGRCGELQERYDERSDNEPEYESQIERWEEALGRLEQQIDELTELNDNLEGLVGLLDEDFKLTEKELKHIVSGYINFNDEYRGITPLLKPLYAALSIYKHTIWNKG